MLFNLSFSPFKVPGDFSNITVCACTKIAGTDVPVGDCMDECRERERERESERARQRERERDRERERERERERDLAEQLRMDGLDRGPFY
jgi:hypothetical protein